MNTTNSDTVLPVRSMNHLSQAFGLNGQTSLPIYQILEMLAQYHSASQIEVKRRFGQEQLRILMRELGFTYDQAQAVMAPMVKQAVPGARWAYRAKAVGATSEWLQAILVTGTRTPNPQWYIQQILSAEQIPLPWGLWRWHEIWGFLSCAIAALKVGLPGYDLPRPAVLPPRG